MLTNTNSERANLRIMASISERNEAADAALATMHLPSSAIKHETMERKLVPVRRDCSDKPGRDDHDEDKHRPRLVLIVCSKLDSH